MAKSNKTKSVNSSDKLFDQLLEAGFVNENGQFKRGQHRVEQSIVNGEEGPVEHIKFYLPGSDHPVFHTNAGVMPSEEFMDKFLEANRE
jgi:hypothetical protein